MPHVEQLLEILLPPANLDMPSTVSLSPDVLSPLQPTDFAEVLKAHALFGTADDQFIQQMTSSVHYRHYQIGDTIVREGEMGKAMFFVVKGVVSVCSADGESIYTDLVAGSFFGGIQFHRGGCSHMNVEIAVIFAVPRTATVRAKTRSLIAVLTQDDLATIMNKDPEIGDDIRNEALERYGSLLTDKIRRGDATALKDKQVMDVVIASLDPVRRSR